MTELLLDVPEPLLRRLLPHPLPIRGWLIISTILTRHSFIAILPRGYVGVMLPSSAGFSFSVSFSGVCSSWGMVLWPSQACRASYRRCICIVSCSNFLSKRWLVRRSAFISLVLAYMVSRAPLGGRLSTSPCWSCILGGLARLLLVFRVDTISH